MNWANIALLSAAIMGVVNIIDSHLLSKRIPVLRVFLLPAAIMHLIYGSILFILFPLPEDIGILPIIIAIVSGLIRTGAVLIMLNTLKKEEVAKVIPVSYTSPIFVAIMAVPLLGESLQLLQWLAIIIVVMGALMVSLQQTPSGNTRLPVKLLLSLFCASILFAIADIMGKYTLAYISAWNMFWLTTFCMCSIFLAISVRPRFIKMLVDMKQRNSALGILVFNETLAPMGIALSFWALKQGPVSLVSTITGSRPMFVVIFAFIVSRLWPAFVEWQSGRGILVLRLCATAMIIGGITLIHLL